MDNDTVTTWGHRRGSGLCLLLLIGLAVVLGDNPAHAQQQTKPPATPAVGSQREERLKEGDRFGQESQRLRSDGKLPQAIAAAEKMLAIEREVYGPEHDDIAGSLRWLAQLHGERNDFATARKLGAERIAVCKKLHGGDDWRVTDARLDLAHLEKLSVLNLDQRRGVAEAERLMQQVRALYAQGKYREAIEPCRQTLSAYQGLLGEENRCFQTTTAWLGVLYDRLGDHAHAEPILRQAVDIGKQMFGKNHPDYAQSLDNLAYLYHRIGKNSQAEPLFQQALVIARRTLGEKHVQYAGTLRDMGRLYCHMGAYAKAEPVLRRAVAIYKNTRGEQHPDYARGLDHLGTLYFRLRNYAKAEPLYQQAMAIRKRVLGEQHPDYGISLNNLALLYKTMGQYPKADALYRQLMALDKQLFGQHALAYVLEMCNLAELYDAMGKYAETQPLLEEALAIREQKLGKDHPDYAFALRYLASHYARMKKPEKALPLIQQALQALRRHFDRTVAAQSERQQLAFRTSIRESFQLYLSLTARLQTPADEVYSEVLAWKAPVSTMQLSLRRMRHALEKKGGQSESARLFAELEQTTHTLAARSHAVPDPGAPIPLREELEELREKVESLQQKLAAASVDFRKALGTRQQTVQDIGKALPLDAVLVDFVEYGRFTPPEKAGKELSWPMHLTAFVVQRGQPVRRIELGPIAPISQAVDAWRKNYGLGGTAAGDLRRLVWEPLSALVDPARVVLISPTSALSRLPFAALPGKRPGTYLLDEHALALIPVPRLLPELIGNMPPASQSPSLLLVGDVDFGADPGRSSQLADARTAIRRYATLYWPPLPGTRGEVLDIETSFRRRFGNAACMELTKDHATKSAVQREAGKHEYLHFSTHGFFTPPQAHTAVPDHAGVTDSGSGQNVTDYQPGLLSGLVLSGANCPTEEGKDDGILTALEVEEMDLSRVQLATLSACETGLGQSAGGEGLLGLQRAFQTAGAKAVVVSLWKVPDEETKALMGAFYANLWQRKLSPLESLRQAQLAMLQSYDSQAGRLRAPDFSQTAALPTGGAAEKPAAVRGTRLSPAYWAAFVLSGDWR